MTDSNRIDGDLIVSDARIAIAVGRFNGFIVESLLAAALDTLHRSGFKAANITVSHVPGALEIPLLVQTFAASGKYDAVIALGGDVPAEVENPDARPIPRILIGRGMEDTWYTKERLENDLARLAKVGGSVQTCLFDGGHEWTADFRAAAGQFLRAL